jgi:hypothetical protein
MYSNQRKIVITESEKQNIKKMYGLVEKRDFVVVCIFGIKDIIRLRVSTLIMDSNLM